MKTYLVAWEIDIEAESPMEAAKRALEIQRDPQSTANQFYVQEHGKSKRTSIDFLELEESENQREWMNAEEAKSIKEGDKLEMLVAGQGEGNEIGVTSYFSSGAVV